MLEKNPDKRLSASEALKLPFVIKHAEYLRNTIVVKHQSKEENDVVNHDTEEIASALSRHAKLSELKRESEQKKFKNLPPRERFRIERQKKADEELQRMKALTLQQAKETKANYEAVRQAQNPYRSTIPLGEQRNREFNAAAKIMDTRPYTIPGIPESKEDAEHYYGQFLDDFEDEDDQSDDDRHAMVNLANNLQFVLDANDQTLTDHTLVSDDKEAGPYGPGAKECKIKNLRAEAIKMLGEDKFKKVYDCTRRLLYPDKRGKKASEHELELELRKITDHRNGCFIVEQLLFLQCST